MRIDIRNLRRERLFSVQVDPRDPPTIVRPSGRGNGDAAAGGAAGGAGGGASGGASGGTSGGGGQVTLNWDRALDDHGYLRGCPVCGCRETFVRKDFPQVTGFLIVVLAAVVATVLFGVAEPILAFTVLGIVALIDAVVFLFSGRCQVCYRCRSEFRSLPIRRDHPKWELATGEKYRQIELGKAKGSGSGADPDATQQEARR